jgi:recombinational DNA repair ATPase RecF
VVINELIIKNFGKFKDKTIEFEDGVNIIYGKNESGKSTIHSFINGMLYGIEKSRLRKTIDIYDKYLPWEDQGVYEGVLKLTIDNKKYRIRRSFLNKKAFCELREEDTGYIIDPNGKEPGEYLLGISESSFKDTVFVGQLLARTSDALAVDIKSYIANLSTTKNTEIELSKVYEQIDKEIKKNGIKFDEKQIIEVENELKEIEQQEKLRDSLSGMLREKSSRLNEVEEKIIELKEIENYLEQKDIQEKYNKCKRIQDEIDNNIEQIQPLKAYSKINEEDLDNITKEITNKKIVLEEIKQTQKKVDEINKQSEEIQSTLLLKNENNREYFDNENRLELCMMKEVEAQNIINSENENNSKKQVKRKNYTKLIFAIIVFTIAMKWFRTIRNGSEILDAVFISIGVAVVGFVIIWISINISNHETQQNKAKMVKVEEELKEASYAKPVLISLNNLDSQLKSEKLILQRKRLELENIEDRLQDVYRKQSISGEEDIALYRNKLNEYRRLANNIDKNENILNALLVGKEIEELKLLAENTKVLVHNSELSKEEILEKGKHLNRERDELVRETSTYMGKLEELEAIDSKRYEAEEKKADLITKKSKIVIEQQAIRLAKDKIHQISEQIQKGFGKQLDKKVSAVVEAITNGKYNNINIGTDSKMTIDDGYNNIDIERLSLGTVDQMFLALRVGVDELLHKDIKLPIILDDSFSLYDDERMNNILKWFIKQEKQLLVFTCQKREMQNLESKEANIILLNDLRNIS